MGESGPVDTKVVRTEDDGVHLGTAGASREYQRVTILLSVAAVGILSGTLPALEGPDGPERTRAIERLDELGIEGVERLGEALDEVGWRAREAILDALVRIGPGATPLLMRVARAHPKVDARRVAVRSLGAIGGTAVRDSLLELLDTPERDMVVQALGTVGDPAAGPLIRGLVDDACVDVRRQAVIALGKTTGVQAVDLLVDGLMDPHHSVRFAAAGAIESLGPEGAGVLLERLDRLSGPSRYLAVRTLGRLGYRPAADRLTQLLADDDWGVRAAAAEALGRLDEDVGRSALEEALRVERHPFVRERIQISLQSPGAR